MAGQPPQREATQMKKKRMRALIAELQQALDEAHTILDEQEAELQEAAEQLDIAAGLLAQANAQLKQGAPLRLH